MLIYQSLILYSSISNKSVSIETKNTVESALNAGSALAKRLHFEPTFCPNLSLHIIIHWYHHILHLWLFTVLKITKSSTHGERKWIGKGLGEKICICSYKNTKADSMLNSAKERTMTIAHQLTALELYSLLQAEAVIRLSKWGYPA